MLVDHLKQVYEAEGIAGLAERAEICLDTLAGPHALTDRERWERRVCRQRFGEYKPGSADQAEYIASLTAAIDLTDENRLAA